jgi:hypothetical protein
LATAAVAGFVAALAAVPAPQSADASGGTEYTTNCPKPTALVTGTNWHKHRLSRAVVLREGQHKDPNGYVDMHVLSVDTTVKRLHFRPLVRKLAMRSKLTRLASGHRRLVAATNAGYYDFRYGTPSGPVVTGGKPLLASLNHQRVIGFTATKRAQAGMLWLTGTVSSGDVTRPLRGLNVLTPPVGFTVYTPKWGSTSLKLPNDAVGRYVQAGHIASPAKQFTSAPTSGYLLVARGPIAQTWLRALRIGDPVKVTKGTATDTARPFRTAYGVGAQIVRPGGIARTDLRCRRNYPQPARTAIGFADRGRRLILAIVADHPGEEMHGLAAGQMARLMADLGAREAYLFDGSGSTEMLARMPTTGRLSLRNWPADGGPENERTMPVGFGIFR